MAAAALPPFADRGDEADLYAQHHDDLLRVVRAAVRGSDALVEDASQNAWLTLLCRQPDRSETLFGWLVTTATREAWRLSRLEMQLGSGGDALEAADRDQRLVTVDLDQRLEARLALAALAALPERPRRYLALHAAGCSYEEIAAASGATYTNVNKHLSRGRRLLRAQH